MYTADRRLYLTVDDRVVESDDPDARWLLVAEGGELSDQVATRYGLIGGEAAESKPVKAKPKGKAKASDEVAEPVEESAD